MQLVDRSPPYSPRCCFFRPTFPRPLSSPYSLPRTRAHLRYSALNVSKTTASRRFPSPSLTSSPLFNGAKRLTRALQSPLLEHSALFIPGAPWARETGLTLIEIFPSHLPCAAFPTSNPCFSLPPAGVFLSVLNEQCLS